MTSACAGKRPRVVQLIPNLAVGGAERMVLNLVTALDRSRWDVRVLTFFDPSGSPVERALDDAGIEVVSLGKRLGFDPRMFQRIHGALARLAPDVLHTHRPVFAYAFPSLGDGLARRVVHTVHSVAQEEVSGRARRFTHRLAFAAGVAPVAICDFVARSLLAVYGVAPRATIPNGVPVAEFAGASGARERWRAAERIPANAVVFTSVARLARPKNPDAIVEAFASLRELSAPATLVLVGDGPLRAAVEGRARALGVAERVRILGARNDVPQALAASDVFVLASDFEGNPLSVMEAMAAGLPVIATAVGGVPELVRPGESGVLVPDSDPVGLGRAMRRLAADAALRQRLGGGAAERARSRFDVTRMAASYARLYEELLAAARRDRSRKPLAGAQID